MNLPLPDDLTEEELHVEIIPVESMEVDRIKLGFVSEERCFRCYRKGWWPLGLARFDAPCCGRLCRWCATVDIEAHAMECNLR